MLLYAIILLLAAAGFFVLAVQIYKGKTELIHDYHQTKVTDRIGYGKAFGKAMGVIAGAMACSGVAALFGQKAMGIAVAVLLTGVAAGTCGIICAQKKYNGGVF